MYIYIHFHTNRYPTVYPKNPMLQESFGVSSNSQALRI